MPKKVGIKVADKLKLPSLFRAHGAFIWIQAISICKPPIGPQSILLGLKSSIYFSPAILGLALMLQTELQVTSPLSSAKKGLYSSSAGLDPSFLGIIIVTQLIPFRGQCLLSLEASLITPDMGGALTLWCTSVLVPTMIPGGSAADIRVRPSDSRVADIHLRDQLIAQFTPLEPVSEFLWVLLGTFLCGKDHHITDQAGVTESV